MCILHNFRTLFYAMFIYVYTRYILDFYAFKCYDMGTLREQNKRIERRKTMYFFETMKDRLLTLCELNRMDADSVFYTARILR